MSEVGDRIIGQFAECLSQRLGEPAQPPSAEEEPKETEPLDLFRTAGVPVAKRAAVGVAAALVVAVVYAGLRRRRGH
jgi:hypothetical protein